MLVKEYENARTYLYDYEIILLEHESVSQLILYSAYQNLTVSASDKCMFGAVLDEEMSVLLFCNVEPYNLVIYIISQDKDIVNAASIAVADYLVNNHIEITGIIAKNDVCTSFMTQYKKNINCIFTETQGMNIMEARKVNEIRPVEGTHRLATINEVKLIADWMIRFQIEALASEMDYEVALKKATSLIENNKVYIYENIEHKVVSMATTSRKLIHGMAISYVYTPEEFRGKGYAAANIYYLSKELLENDNEFCTLFVDKKNLISNRAYEKVGYKTLEENYEFVIQPIESQG